jgi:type I restriction enzyme S subunit
LSLQGFFDNFVVLTEVPNGVGRLRELILQLAVRGQLDTQNQNDESASLLLRRIQDHRAQLLKNKLIRNSPPLSRIEENEIPFNIPSSWQWVRLGEIGDWGAGATPDRQKLTYYGGEIRWFKSGELNDGHIHESEENITELALNECSLRLNQPGDVLIAMYGATIGKLAILDIEATTNQAVCACTCFDGFCNQFLFVLLRAYKNHFAQRGSGGAQPNISREKIIHTVAPLPPLEEQKRIVVKIDELMRLCDELEERQQAKRESRVRLNNAVLVPLNRAASLSCDEFEQATTRLVENFETLYDSIDTVAKLRSTILQLAIQGRLVAQDPSDRPSQELLKRIQCEIAEQQTAGIYKSPKPLPPISKAEQPFPLPLGWQWSRLRSLVFTLGDGLHGTPEYSKGTDCYFINGNNFVEGRIVIKPQTKTVSLAEMEKHKKPMTSNTVLVSINGTLGNVAFYNNENIVLGKRACYFNLASLVNKHFVRRVIESSYFVDYAIANATGTTIRNLGLKAMNHFPVPLPPLEEQERIVSKVNQLMSLCDEVETKLRQAKADSEKLMNAAVQHVLKMISGDDVTPSELEQTA